MWIKFVFIFLFANVLSYADWNADFDRGSKSLIAEFPEFKSAKYVKDEKWFRSIRKALLKDGVFKKKIYQSPWERKLMILRPRDQLVIKKREKACYFEAIAWEISLLLDADTCFVPSFPIDFDGKKMVIQKMEPFTFGRGVKELPSPFAIKKVSLFEYWKAHFEAYLLGLEDLLGRNIGITPSGKIRFFDAEAAFRYRKQPSKGWGVHNISVGFMSESFEWPQYRMPLDETSALLLQNFLKKWDLLEEQIALYEKCRGHVIEEGFFERLSHIREFPLQAGTSFRDFLGYIYPKMNPGLDELSELISGVYGRRVDHGSSLIFMYRHMPGHALTEKQTAEIDDWIERYID